MLPGLEMMGCQNLAVPAEVMQHVVNVESSRNPFAIGVVGGQLVRQPQNLPEAVATVRMLEEKGYNYSLGVAQVNRSNLGKYGLDTFEKAFDVCPNVQAGSQILAQCYASAGKDWGKAFSCYYSGNFTTGYRDGYVQRVYESIARSTLASASAIPLQGQKIPVRVVKVGNGVTGMVADTPAYRVAMRSVLDAAASALVPVASAADAAPQTVAQQQLPADVQNNLPIGTGYPGMNPVLDQGPTPPPGRIPTDPGTAAAMSLVGPRLPQSDLNTQAGRIATDPATAAVMSQIGVSANANGNAPAPMPQAQDNGVFVPQVHGPNDPAQMNVARPTQAQPAAPARDPADLRTGGGDGAFVF
ncbi:transglycosylase SLT domain-containing protein [Luteibacter anthropi]|uniref:Transglycosylase SLT domain-containing protein n=1 Tax=Luteibacter anthropi TaxID=564369 RepID=A0A7X5ZHW5_9GAMM|nr:transglycosylase SLT domain-containing protein [Luteibacter anthropi]